MTREHAQEQSNAAKLKFEHMQRIFDASTFSDEDDRAFMYLSFNVARVVGIKPSKITNHFFDSSDLSIAVMNATEILLKYACNPLSLIREIAGLHPVDNLENLLKTPVSLLDPYNGHSKGATFLIIDPRSYLYGILITAKLNFIINNTTISLTQNMIFKKFVTYRIQNLESLFRARITFYKEFQWVLLNSHKHELQDVLLAKINKLISMLDTIGKGKMFVRSIADAQKIGRENAELYEKFVRQHKDCLIELQDFLSAKDRKISSHTI